MYEGIVLRASSRYLGVCSFLLLVFTLVWQQPVVSHAALFIAPPLELRHLSFGFEEVCADGLWLKAIQNFDICKVTTEGTNLCPNPWLYKMLNLITELSPHFRNAYLSGALALEILVNDEEGAGQLYDKAVTAFPNDWKILYYAGYHFLYEAKDPKKAAGYFVRAGEHGAPNWVFSLAGRLYAESGNPKLAQELLKKMIESEQDPALIKRMREKIESLDSH